MDGLLVMVQQPKNVPLYQQSAPGRAHGGDCGAEQTRLLDCAGARSVYISAFQFVTADTYLELS
eukprot:6173004-Pleurochrysis_carterae.AAC.5